MFHVHKTQSAGQYSFSIFILVLAIYIIINNNKITSIMTNPW